MDDFSVTLAGAPVPQAISTGARAPVPDSVGFLAVFAPVADDLRLPVPLPLGDVRALGQPIDPRRDPDLPDGPGASPGGSQALAQAAFQPDMVQMLQIIAPMGWQNPGAGAGSFRADGFGGQPGPFPPGGLPAGQPVAATGTSPMPYDQETGDDVVGRPPFAQWPVEPGAEAAAGPPPRVQPETPPFVAIGPGSPAMPPVPRGAIPDPAAHQMGPSPFAPPARSGDGAARMPAGVGFPDPTGNTLSRAILAADAKVQVQVQGQAIAMDSQAATPAKTTVVAARTGASPGLPGQDVTLPAGSGLGLDPGTLAANPAPPVQISGWGKGVGGDQDARTDATPKAVQVRRDGLPAPASAAPVAPAPVASAPAPVLHALANDEPARSAPVPDSPGGPDRPTATGAGPINPGPVSARSSGSEPAIPRFDGPMLDRPEAGAFAARVPPPGRADGTGSAGDRSAPSALARDRPAPSPLAVSSAPVDAAVGPNFWPGPAADGTVSPSPTADRPAPSVLPSAPAVQILQALVDPGRDRDAPLDLALDPPELGRLRLSFSDINGALTLVIAAERPETADLMRRHLGLLAQEFARAGIDAPMVSISNGGADGRHDQKPAIPMPHAPGGGGPQGEHPAPPRAQTAPTPSRGGLDLRV